MNLPTITLTPRRLGLLILGGLLVAVALVASGCGLNKITEPFQDAPVYQHLTGPAVVSNMPDGFSNWASKCDGHGDRVFVAYHGDANRAAIAVIRDPSCQGAASEATPAGSGQ
jgi:hypothetical protein